MWSSLEIVKLLVQALIPVVVVIVGYLINRNLKRIEAIQWTNQKVTEKRLEVFEKMAPQLNDLLCYFRYIGCWKELSPSQVVACKRELDRTAYIYQALFSEQFLDKYNQFINKCYKMYSGWGEDPKLLTLTTRRRNAAGDSWEDGWEDYFAAPSEVSDTSAKEVEKAYRELMSWFSNELGAGFHLSDIRSGRNPSNIR